jgi:molybdenum cofactor cytidylyltransferase
MPRSPGFFGVILAAGESTRMGRDKALLPWPPPTHEGMIGNETFLSSAIKSLLDFCDSVIVVAGNNEPQLAPLVYTHNASLIRNPAPERGQFSSLQLGLQQVLNRGRDAAMITLVDRPPVRSQTLGLLREAFLASPARIWAVVPEYKGQHGHPYIVGRELIHAFLNAPPTASARDIEHREQGHIQYVPVEDPFATLNIDTPEDYATLLSQPATP